MRTSLQKAALDRAVQLGARRGYHGRCLCPAGAAGTGFETTGSVRTRAFSGWARTGETERSNSRFASE